MKGIILAGGKATRLRPLTKITSKQLLPVYDKPMIYYPINTLVSAGIKDILIIIAPDYAGQFLNLLGDGKEFGVRFSYAIQDQPRGLADAFIMGEDFIDSEPVAMILGDNIFEHNFVNEVAEFKSGGMIFVKDVSDPNRFGIAQVDKKGNVISIEEKPVKPKSNLAIVGFYVFDGQVAQVAKEIQPSERGELEITEIQKHYLHQKKLVCKKISGMWEDAGTFDSLLRVGNFMAQKTEKAI